MTVTKTNLEYPRLRHCTFVIRNDKESIFMVFGKDYYEVSKSEGDYKMFMSLKRYMDGRHSIKQISENTGVREEDVREIIESLNDLGLFRQEEKIDKIKTDVFLKAIKDIAIMWSRQIGYHRLYAELERNELPKEVFIGLFIETYHYVASAPKHIATAISHCNDKNLEKILVDYFIDEHNHAGLLAETLENLGVSRKVLETANPGIGTTSMINMLCDIGRNSSLAYIATTALFEARQDDFEPAKKSFEKICTQFGFKAEAIQPFLEHMRGDIEAGHESLLEEALKDREYITAKEAHEIVNFVHDVKHAFDQFHDQIIAYYNDNASYIPRLYVDYFSL